MDVKFTDACHIRINGKNVYKDSIKSLKRSYFLRNLSKMIYKHSPMINTGLAVMSILTSSEMHRKRVEDIIKLHAEAQRMFEDYKRGVK